MKYEILQMTFRWGATWFWIGLLTCQGQVVIENTHVNNWGTWRSPIMCPSGSFIKTFSLRSEIHQLLGDDTALNDICISCADAATGNKSFVGNSLPPSCKFL